MTTPSPLTELQALGQAFDGGWRDISSAPRDGTRVLLWCVETAGETSRPEACSLPYVGEWWGGKSDYPGDDWWTLPSDGYAMWGRAVAWKPIADIVMCAACNALDFACDCNQIVAAGLAPVGGE